jgi:hypothetical protein
MPSSTTLNRENKYYYKDAKRREYYLKTTGGRHFLAKRLKSYYLSCTTGYGF